MTISFFIGCFVLVMGVIGSLKRTKENGIDVIKEADYELLKYNTETGNYKG